ncbi:MAG: hypothetical protein O7D30_03200 [Rickettsia endosymbiont of Ixodes persulcatus]|nr:hypothetical protein [Rickettsia endosymbiont of Ixodes persulcatus]
MKTHYTSFTTKSEARPVFQNLGEVGIEKKVMVDQKPTNMLFPLVIVDFGRIDTLFSLS